MTCIDDGILRARLDGELAGTELTEVNQHLAACADCGARFKRLSTETGRTADLLATLVPVGNDNALNPAVAYIQFRSQLGTADEPKVSWIAHLFQHADDWQRTRLASLQADQSVHGRQRGGHHGPG